MLAVLRKTPVPMMIPTTREVACVSVRSRRGCRSEELTSLSYNQAMAGHEHRASIHWARGAAAFTDNRYSRAHSWRFDGGVEVPASSSPQVVRAPLSVEAAVDREEALVAALSSCHMLWFLSLAAGGGWRVDDYSDDALGVMGKNAAGRTPMVRVTLRPRVAFSGERLPARADVLSLPRGGARAARARAARCHADRRNARAPRRADRARLQRRGAGRIARHTRQCRGRAPGRGSVSDIQCAARMGDHRRRRAPAPRNRRAVLPRDSAATGAAAQALVMESRAGARRQPCGPGAAARGAALKSGAHRHEVGVLSPMICACVTGSRRAPRREAYAANWPWKARCQVNCLSTRARAAAPRAARSRS